MELLPEFDLCISFLAGVRNITGGAVVVLVWKNTNEKLQHRVSTHTGTVRIREVLHHPLHLRLLQPTVSSLSRYFSELPLVGIRCRYSLQSSDANAIFFIFVRVFRRFCNFFFYEILFLLEIETNPSDTMSV